VIEREESELESSNSAITEKGNDQKARRQDRRRHGRHRRDWIMLMFKSLRPVDPENMVEQYYNHPCFYPSCPYGAGFVVITLENIEKPMCFEHAKALLDAAGLDVRF
jgi:hypothetical protein